jgi:hypothetical protein
MRSNLMVLSIVEKAAIACRGERNSRAPHTGIPPRGAWKRQRSSHTGTTVIFPHANRIMVVRALQTVGGSGGIVYQFGASLRGLMLLSPPLATGIDRGAPRMEPRPAANMDGAPEDHCTRKGECHAPEELGLERFTYKLGSLLNVSRVTLPWHSFRGCGLGSSIGDGLC